MMHADGVVKKIRSSTSTTCASMCHWGLRYSIRFGTRLILIHLMKPPFNLGRQILLHLGGLSDKLWASLLVPSFAITLFTELCRRVPAWQYLARVTTIDDWQLRCTPPTSATDFCNPLSVALMGILVSPSAHARENIRSPVDLLSQFLDDTGHLSPATKFGVCLALKTFIVPDWLTDWLSVVYLRIFLHYCISERQNGSLSMFKTTHEMNHNQMASSPYFLLLLHSVFW